jgi:hypothetical protein
MIGKPYGIWQDQRPTIGGGTHQDVPFPRIVAHIPVEVQRLRVAQIGVWHRLRRSGPIRRRKPALRPREVPRAEVIEAGFFIAFLDHDAISGTPLEQLESH